MQVSRSLRQIVPHVQQFTSVHAYGTHYSTMYVNVSYVHGRIVHCSSRQLACTVHYARRIHSPLPFVAHAGSAPALGRYRLRFVGNDRIKHNINTAKVTRPTPPTAWQQTLLLPEIDAFGAASSDWSVLTRHIQAPHAVRRERRKKMGCFLRVFFSALSLLSGDIWHDEVG